MNSSIGEGSVEYHVAYLDPEVKVDLIHQVRTAPPMPADHPSLRAPREPAGNDALAEMLRNIGNIGNNTGARNSGPQEPPHPEESGAPAPNPADLEEEMLQAAIRASLGDDQQPEKK